MSGSIHLNSDQPDRYRSCPRPLSHSVRRFMATPRAPHHDRFGGGGVARLPALAIGFRQDFSGLGKLWLIIG